MRTRKTISMLYVAGFLIVGILVVGVPFLSPINRIAHGHTFSTTESAQFLSLVEQIRAHTGLVMVNLDNNNITLANDHAERAVNMLSNSTLDEISESNIRIADTLETTLLQLRDNVSSLADVSAEQIPPDRVQSIDQIGQTLNDALSEAVTVRIESEQRNNSTTWAMVIANLTNTILSNYGNATGATFDLTDMTNLAGMGEESAVTSNQGIINNTTPNNTSVSDGLTNIIIVDEAAYQTSQYLANNTMLQLFNDVLRPISPTTTGTNNMTASNNNNNNTTSSIDSLEQSLLQLRDAINSRASPNEVMTIAHLQIHPALMQLYGLIPENEENMSH
jgi:hypothetical protein